MAIRSFTIGLAGILLVLQPESAPACCSDAPKKKADHVLAVPRLVSPEQSAPWPTAQLPGTGNRPATSRAWPLQRADPADLAAPSGRKADRQALQRLDSGLIDERRALHTTQTRLRALERKNRVSQTERFAIRGLRRRELVLENRVARQRAAVARTRNRQLFRSGASGFVRPRN